MTYKATALLLILLVVLPTVQAAADPTVEGSIQEYNLYTFSSYIDDPSPGAFGSPGMVNTAPQHAYTVTNAYGVITVNFAISWPELTTSSTGGHIFTLEWDNVTIKNADATDCAWRYRQGFVPGNALGAFVFPTYSQYVQGQIFCRLNNAQLTGEVDNVHKFNLRFVNQGTPLALRVLAFSVRIDRYDQLTAAGSPIQDTLKAALVYRTDQTNDYVNATFAATYDRLNSIWTRLNTTCQKTAFSMAGCEGLDVLISNLCTGEEDQCIFNVNNTEVVEALGETEMKFIGYSSAESWTILGLLALLIWALYKGWYFVAGGMTLAVLGVLLRLGEWTLPSAVFLIVLTFWLELWINNNRREAET